MNKIFKAELIHAISNDLSILDFINSFHYRWKSNFPLLGPTAVTEWPSQLCHHCSPVTNEDSRTSSTSGKTFWRIILLWIASKHLFLLLLNPLQTRGSGTSSSGQTQLPPPMTSLQYLKQVTMNMPAMPNTSDSLCSRSLSPSQHHLILKLYVRASSTPLSLPLFSYPYICLSLSLMYIMYVWRDENEMLT